MEALGLDVLFMGSNATRLLQGLWVAVQISAISVVLSIILGMLFGIFMTWKNPVAKVISRLYLEIVRIMPQLVLLYIVFFGTGFEQGADLPPGNHPAGNSPPYPLIYQSHHPHDQNNQLAADDRCYRDDEGWPADHRGEPHDLPQRRIRHLRHHYVAVFRNLLAHQHAGKPPREEMELSNERYRPALH